MRSYSELLEEYIKLSGLKLVEISEALKERGISIDRSYLSKLRNGKVSPASEDITIAIAEITSQDPEELLLAAHLEKAPKKLKSLLLDLEFLEGEFTALIQDYLTVQKPLARQRPDIYSNLLKKGINPYDNEEFNNQLSKKLTLLEKWELLQRLNFRNNINTFTRNDYLSKAVDDSESISIRDLYGELTNEKGEIIQHQDNLWHIPIVKKIFFGQKLHYQDFEGLIKCDLATNCDDSDFLYFTYCLDDGLYDIDVQPGDQILVQSPNLTGNYDVNDILLVSVGSLPAVFRKMQKFGDYYILRPLNKNMEVEVVHKNEARIAGKALEVRKIRQLA